MEVSHNNLQNCTLNSVDFENVVEKIFWELWSAEMVGLQFNAKKHKTSKVRAMFGSRTKPRKEVAPKTFPQNNSRSVGLSNKKKFG